MNPLQNKAVSALHIFAVRYVLLFMMLLGVDNAQAQQNSNAQSRIVGYWRGDYQTVYGGFDMTVITYDAVFADGSAKSVALGVGNGRKIPLTATYKHWFEGKYFCTQPTGKSEISKSTLDWVSDNEGYQTWVNGESKGVKAHYVRVPKDTFEKYFNNSVLLLDIEIPQSTISGTQSGFNNKIIGYWKFDSQFNLEGDNVTIIGYKNIRGEGRGQEITLMKINSNAKIYNFDFEYWFEGKYYCTPKTGKHDVSRCTLDFLNEDEFYAEYISGIREGFTDHYTRVTKEEFEKYAEHPNRIRGLAQPDHSPHPEKETYPNEEKQKKFRNGCWTCLQSGKVNCSVCGGEGRTKQRVLRNKWNHHTNQYETDYEDVWSDCTADGCVSGKVPCTNPSCPYKR